MIGQPQRFGRWNTGVDHMKKIGAKKIPIILSGCIFLLSIAANCSRRNEIPHPPLRPDSARETAIPSPLLKYADELKATKDTKNYAQMINIGEDALLARAHLIRSAKKNICLQTIIWVNDEVGRLMIYEIINAAKRGVKVRLLVDHLPSEKNVEFAAFLSTVSPNLDVKVYNPIGFPFKKMDPSVPEQLLQLTTEFNKFGQRMHNKLFIVDDAIAITGGRNVENSYFDMAKGMNYKDRDVMVTGPVVNEMRKSFEHFWKFKYATSLKAFSDVRQIIDSGKIKTWDSRESYELHGFFTRMDAAASNPSFISSKFADQFLAVDRARFIADAPGKNRRKWFGRFKGKGAITLELADLISDAKQNIYIQSPYLVLSNDAIHLFKDLKAKRPDMDIRISTNSLAATDAWHAYAASFKQKQIYLKTLNFIIYEFKPVPGDMQQLMPSYKTLARRPLTPLEKFSIGKKHSTVAQSEMDRNNPTWIENLKVVETKAGKNPAVGKPYLCLHAKSMVIDDTISFIGSYNLDPRSENLNTEVGIVITDKTFARLLKNSIKKDMEPQNAWVIAKRQWPLGIHHFNAWMETVSRILPVDIWPIRYASSFKLKKGKKPLDPDRNEFYQNYTAVGSFPELSDTDGDKIIGAWLVKSFFGFVTPIL